MDELCDLIQYEEYCKYDPCTPSEWDDIKIAWLTGLNEDDPFYLDDDTVVERAMRRVN